MTESVSEADDISAVLEELLRERGLIGRASVVQVAQARAAARLLCDGSPSSASAAATLLGLLPAVVHVVEAPEREFEPELTLEQMAEPRAWDLSKLSTAQLWQLEAIEAVACARACPVWSERLDAAIEVVRLVDLAGDVRALAFNRESFVVAIRTMIKRIVAPTPVDVIWPSYQAEAETTKARVAVLEAALAEQRVASHSNVVRLRREAAAYAGAP